MGIEENLPAALLHQNPVGITIYHQQFYPEKGLAFGKHKTLGPAGRRLVKGKAGRIVAVETAQAI